jgi:hypothetical protein
MAADLINDPDVQLLDPSLAPPAERSGRHQQIVNLLFLAAERHLAVRTDTPGGSRYTIALPGESQADLLLRHADDMIVSHPAIYLPSGFMMQVLANHPVGEERRRYLRAAELALDDGRLAVTWYPDGLPSLIRPLEGDALAHFRGYTAALAARAEEYAACIAQGPRRLRQELEGARLPCRPSSPAPSRHLTRADRHAVPNARPVLWMPLQSSETMADIHTPAPIFLLDTIRDPVTQMPRRVIGAAQLSLDGVSLSGFTKPLFDVHRCCPEVSSWLLDTPRGELRFHLWSGSLPPLPSVRPRRGLGGETGYEELRALGWLVAGPSPGGNTWRGLLLWASGTEPRAWEEVDQDGLLPAIQKGRSWNRATGELRTAAGLPAPTAPPQVVRMALTLALPYTVQERLREL